MCIRDRFYPAAEYQKVAMTLSKNGEKLFANFKYLINDGYLKVAANSFSKKKDDVKYSPEFIARLAKIKKGDKLSVCLLYTSRYSLCHRG